MAQVMVNFRLDEEIKKSMEQACREMGLSMTTAFTIFAKKVGSEKRIPFEITAESRRPDSRREQGEDQLLLVRKQERLELLCAAIRRSLTAIHTGIPASITGLSMERVRMLCGDELKDKAAGTASAAKSLFSSRSRESLAAKDLSLLDEYLDGLSAVAEELSSIEHTLIPAMKSWRGESSGDFQPYEQRLAAVSQRFDALTSLLQRFLQSSACGAYGVRTRLRQAARPVETAYVLSALDNLESLLVRCCDTLEERTQERLESDYLHTLELALRELAQAERNGGDVSGTAALCLRVINVLSQVISDSWQTRQEWSGRSLEAEVAALERLAAMRGDIVGGMKPEG